MSCCQHCNFRNTDQCEFSKISERVEEGEISQDQAQLEYENVLSNCEDKYYDYLVRDI